MKAVYIEAKLPAYTDGAAVGTTVQPSAPLPRSGKGAAGEGIFSRTLCPGSSRDNPNSRLSANVFYNVLLLSHSRARKAILEQIFDKCAPELLRKCYWRGQVPAMALLAAPYVE